MNSICDNCSYKLQTWSEDLREEYRGCGYFLENDGCSLYNSITDYIEADEIATGWICNGKMAFNNQLITKNTRSCKLRKY